MARTNFTTPVGRLLMGSLYKAQTTDAEGKPLVNKSGSNIGQPKVQYFFAVGIPKGTEQHWSQTEWGSKIWAVGHAAFPQQAQGRAFAWKVVDGDSQEPNRTGKKPCDREGYRGNWVVSFTSGFAPKIYNKDGTAQIVEPDAVKLGYYVQVNGDVDGNGSSQQPGVFVNHSMVALSAYGPEIVVGPDAASVGFGTAPLPAGAMAAPVGGFNPVTPATPAPQAYQPPAPAAAYQPPVPAAAYAPPAPAMAAPAPNPAFLAVPPAPAMPPVPLAPPAPAPKQMTAKAGGATYEQMIAAGWNDTLLVQHGMMV